MEEEVKLQSMLLILIWDLFSKKNKIAEIKFKLIIVINQIKLTTLKISAVQVTEHYQVLEILICSSRIKLLLKYMEKAISLL
jgi:hypothetical protein